MAKALEAETSAPRVLTLDQAADVLQVSHTTVYEYCRVYADFPVIRLSARTWRVREDQLLEWLAGRVGKTPAPLSITDSARQNDRRMAEAIARDPRSLPPQR